MAVLDVAGVTVRFGGLMALERRDDHGRSRADHRAHRSERCREDDVVQRDHWPAAATVGAGRLDGRDVTSTSAYKRARLGLARTFQRLEVFDSLTVRDNIQVAAESTGERATSTA